MGWLHRSAGARRGRRREHFGPLEQEQQGFTLDTGDTHVCDPSGALRSIGQTINVDRCSLDDVGHGGEKAIKESIAQCPKAFDAGRAFSSGETGGSGHGNDASDVLRPRSTVSFLTTTELHGVHDGRGARHERADTLRTSELMGAHTHQIGVAGDMGNIGPAERLHRIGVHERFGRMTSHELGDPVDGLERADLVVDGHHRNKADARAFAGVGSFGLSSQHIGELIQIDPSEMIDTDQTTAEMLDGIENCVMLDRAADRDSGLTTTGFTCGGSRCAEHRKVVGLGATARVDDVAGISTEEFGEFVSRLINSPPGITGPSMRAGWIGEAIGEEWQHRLDRFGSHWPGGRMVEVGTHLSKGTGGRAHLPLRSRSLSTDRPMITADWTSD